MVLWYNSSLYCNFRQNTWQDNYKSIKYKWKFMGIDEMKKSIKERIRYLMRTNKFLHPIYKLVVFKKRKMVYLRFHKELPLRENTIIFEAFQARRYDCSPRGIYEAALKDERFKDFKFIWSFICSKVFLSHCRCYF